MATLALSLAGQFAGGLLGGPLGATIGRALGAMAGSAVDGMLFGETPQPATSDIRLQGSSEGGAIPRLYGWSRLAGNIIWARELEIIGGEGGGAKGFGAPEEDAIGASFAVAFCEGEVQRLGRIWADGQLLDTRELTLRFYPGTENQLPDGLIEATQGEAPAYRGLCYLVVEQLPLARFGNRVPQLTVELCRAVGTLERDMRAVTVIPGATEFGYDPSPRLRMVRSGETASENTHLAPGISDWSWSIDELTDLCPNLEHVALVVTWFGNDLRCGHCTVAPRVESATRNVDGAAWKVAGLRRGDVEVVSRHDGGAAYGGTPSDASVLAAIADLKARGLKVTLYPLIMMDVPQGNGLPDPYGGNWQAPYPWRGRISCYPAPGQPGSPDGTAAATAQIDAFAAAYRGMVMHYADLATEAGGVNALIIGSEMRGLTTVRGPNNSFPFVSALVALAADVRAVVGAGTKLTYAADWSEYGGYQPAGEKFFHLDPLWASPAIDAVGIDNYMPLADWRDGTAHHDAALSASGYDLDYLEGNIAGGEGFDWFYQNDADRLVQQRTPITDGAYGEPWVWRFKDLRNWWSQPHHDRPGGTRNAQATAWVPGSKPIWLTELGCGAVDKGANQPNIFADGKSAEGGLPYHSSGASDALMQRQFLRAHHGYWRREENNPQGMLDVSRIYCWTWDARPFPVFPGMPEVWADSRNHRTGHWLTGRLGGLASDELAEAVAADHGLALTAEAAAPLLGGYVLGTASSGREALEPLADVAGLSLRNSVGGLHLGAPRRQVVTLAGEALVRGEEPVLSRRRGDGGEAPGRLALNYVDRGRDYRNGTVTAVTRADGPLREEAVSLTLDGAGARLAAERLLDSRSAARETLVFELPPSNLALEPGDLVTIDDLAEGPFEITEVRDGLGRKISARSLPNPQAVAVDEEAPVLVAGNGFSRSVPLVVAAHLPALPTDGARTRLVLAAHARPWPGPIEIVDDVTGATLIALRARATLGTLASDLGTGPDTVWDGQTVEVELLAGHLASATPGAVLGGINRLAVEGEGGGWEVIGFAQAELVAPSRYRLGQLLRGLDGTPASASARGSRVVVLDGRVGTIPVEPGWLGDTRQLRVHAGRTDLDGESLSVTLGVGPALPLAPVHLSAVRQPNGDVLLSWMRRSRLDAGGWGTADVQLDHAPERYLLQVMNGGSIVRTRSLDAPSAIYSAADQLADLGSLLGGWSFSVAQVSAVFGPGHWAQGECNG